MAFRVGQALEVAAVRATIQQLFRTGRYSDIQADATRSGNGVRVTFLHEPAWFVGDVTVEGVRRPPSQQELVSATRLRLGELFTEQRLQEGIRSLKSTLARHGYRRPAVEHGLRHQPATQQVDVSIQVTSGPRARIGDLVLQGDGPLAEGEVRSIARWKRGSRFRSDSIQRGIRHLRNRLRRQDYWSPDIRVDASADPSDQNLVALHVHIAPGPKMLVRVEGVRIGSGRLRRFLPIFTRGTVDEDLLAAGRVNLRELFQSKGFYRAQVESEVELESDEEIVIVYRVERGSKRILRDFEIEGNRYFDTDTVREQLQLDSSRAGLSQQRFTQERFDQGLEALQGIYRSDGFREASVEGDLIDTPERLALRIRINEGTQTLVERLVTSGLEGTAIDASGFEFDAGDGQPFSENRVRSDRRRILADFYDAGYRDVRFAWRTEPGSSPDRLVLHYDIDAGRQTSTGQVFVFGSRKTKADVLRNQVELRPGEPLSQARMFATQRNLYDLGVFSNVDVAIQNPLGLEDTKNVMLHVDEARRWAVGAGGGAEFARIGRNTAELTNPAGDATFSPRMTLEISRLNVWGKAHTMGVRTRLSLLQQRGLFTYEAPRWFDSDRWAMTLTGLYDTFRNVNTFRGRRLEGAFQLAQQLDGATTVLYRYAYRRTAIDQETLNIEPLLVPLVSQPARVGQVSSTFIADRRDDPTDTAKGIYNTVNVGIASKFLGSQPNFARLLAQNSTYHSLTPNVVFARTVQLGVNLPWAGASIAGIEQARFAGRPDPRIPISERFFGGGANSHRGFPYNQAGPRDPATGFPLGGGSQFLNSIELRFPFPGTDFSGVVFHDAGNVYSSPGRISFRPGQQVSTKADGTKAFDFDYMVHAMGFGIRYRTPIGPVRFDLAYSPNPPRFVGFDGSREQLLNSSGTFRQQRISPVQFHFSLGQTF